MWFIAWTIFCIVIKIVWTITGVNAPTWYNGTYYHVNSSRNSSCLKIAGVNWPLGLCTRWCVCFAVMDHCYGIWSSTKWIANVLQLQPCTWIDWELEDIYNFSNLIRVSTGHFKILKNQIFWRLNRNFQKPLTILRRTGLMANLLAHSKKVLYNRNPSRSHWHTMYIDILSELALRSTIPNKPTWLV